MKRTLAVLQQLLSSYLSVALAYRFDFLQSIIASLLWSGFSFVSAILVTTQTPSVFGLSRVDLLLLAAAYGVIVGTHHLLCSRGFAGFPEIIHRGELDGYLLKPFDPLIFLSLRNIAWGSMFRVLGSIFMLIWLLDRYNFSVNPLQIAGFILLSVFAFFLVYSLYSLCCTVLIWHPYLSNIIDFIQNAVGAGRYPLDIARYTPRMVSFIYLPFLLVVNIPTRVLTGRLDLTSAILFAGFCVGTFVFSRWFWKKALWSYTGAGA